MIFYYVLKQFHGFSQHEKTKIIKEDITVWNSTKSHCYFDECEMQEDGECETNGGLAFSGRFSCESILSPSDNTDMVAMILNGNSTDHQKIEVLSKAALLGLENAIKISYYNDN